MAEDTDKKNLEIEDVKDEKKDKEQGELETPAYLTQLDLSIEDKERLSKEFFLELDAIIKERKDAGFDDKWDTLGNLYEGVLEENEDQQFNLHKHTAKVKVDTVTNFSSKAFLNSDPMISISPRPEYAKEGGKEVCEKQQDYIDYKLDEGKIPFRSPISKVIHSAGLYNGGILKIPWEIRVVKRKREEEYQGNPIYKVATPDGDVLGEMDQKQLDEFRTKVPDAKFQIVKNSGLEDFLKAYPDAPEKYPSKIKQLIEGKKIHFIATYDDIAYNDPKPKYVDTRNFYCRLSVEGYEGLKYTKLHAEKMNYTWWELKGEEKRGLFEDVDELKYQYEKGKKKTTTDGKGVEKDNFENENFDVYEAVFYYKMKVEDEEESKIVFWIEKDSRKVIGAINYPYYTVDCYYVPFFIMKKWAGFYQPGVAEYLIDSNIAENNFLNFTLEALWSNNMITPITPEGSAADIQFHEKQFEHGVPINAKKEDIDFLQRYMKAPDVGGLVAMMNILTRVSDDVSRVSSLTTGGESEIDPNAPATKTIALLKQSGINIEEYIENLAPSFNEVCNIILQMTYQMSKENRKYKSKRQTNKENELFSEITRVEMFARTNIQSQAMAFDFDKLNAKREDVALFSMVRQEPLVAKNPQAVWTLLRNIIKGWSPKWRNQVDLILPDLDTLKKQQMAVTVQAVAMYVKQAAEKAQITKQPIEFDPNELMAVVSEAAAEMVTPVPPEVQKARAKQAQEAGARG